MDVSSFDDSSGGGSSKIDLNNPDSYTVQDHRVVGADSIELHFLLEAISAHVVPHLAHNTVDGARDFCRGRLIAQAEDRVTHHDRRLCRI